MSNSRRVGDGRTNRKSRTRKFGQWRCTTVRLFGCAQKQPERSVPVAAALSQSDRRGARAAGREMAASGQRFERKSRPVRQLCIFEERERREDRAQGGERRLLAGSALQRASALASGERLSAVRTPTGARLVQIVRQIDV